MKRILIWLAISALMMATPLTSEAETVNWNENTSIDAVIAYPSFGDWGRLIFPADEGYYSGSTNDGIASYRTMERRIAAIQANGTDAMIEVFPGLSHGFGLGTGTVAEGWIDNAVAFWQSNMN